MRYWYIVNRSNVLSPNRQIGGDRIPHISPFPHRFLYTTSILLFYSIPIPSTVLKMAVYHVGM